VREITAAITRVGQFRLHPLGFFYLLDKLGERTACRVHVWPAEITDKPDNDRHQHSFDISSMILAGRLRSEVFTFTESSDGSEREFRVNYNGGRSELTPTGRSGFLERICMFDSSAGSSYFLQSGVIHGVVVLERPCITVLTTTDRGTPVFTYGSDVSEPTFERRLVSKAESAQIARLLATVV
jgi:hypothetical protein